LQELKEVCPELKEKALEVTLRAASSLRIISICARQAKDHGSPV
jgi:hypothetical protein